jgi:hypothetical protein
MEDLDRQEGLRVNEHVQPDGLSPRPHGPWDAAEVDVSEAPIGRVDLGCVLIPAVPGMELRVETEQATGSITGVTIVLGDSAMQLSAFAAPRTAGIWQDVLGQLRSSLTSQGATSDLVDGEFGPEVTATLGGQQLRFVGVNGPRWFLRGVLQGPAASGGAAAEDLMSVLRGCVVTRDNTPMAPGDPLPLQIAMTDTQPVHESPDGSPT